MDFSYLKRIVRKLMSPMTAISRVSGYRAGEVVMGGTTLPALDTIVDVVKTFGVDDPPAAQTSAEVFKHEDGTTLVCCFTLTGANNGTAVLQLNRLEPHYAAGSKYVQWVRHPVCLITVTAGSKTGLTPPNADPVVTPNTEFYADTISVTWDRSLPPLLVRKLVPRDSSGVEITADNSIAEIAIDGLGSAYHEWQAGTLAASATGVRVHEKWL